MSVLTTTARKEYYLELENSLPLPVLDQLEYQERRLATAVEAFDALRPGDAYEGRLAVRIVLCGAHAVDCLREAGVYRDDYAKQTRCRAQAASMMRAESSAKRTLEREQKVRLGAAAVTGAVAAPPAVAARPAEQAEPQASFFVQTAASVAPPAQAAQAAQAASSAGKAVAAMAPPGKTVAAMSPPGKAVAAAAPLPAPEQSAVALPRPAAGNPGPQPAQPGSAPPPSAEAVAKAEAFALAAGVAAAQIRHDRGVTPQSKAYFRRVALPTDPAVIDALVRGTSAALRVLDDAGGAMLDAAD
jgi:hypothetical protein